MFLRPLFDTTIQDEDGREIPAKASVDVIHYRSDGRREVVGYAFSTHIASDLVGRGFDLILPNGETMHCVGTKVNIHVERQRGLSVEIEFTDKRHMKG